MRKINKLPIILCSAFLCFFIVGCGEKEVSSEVVLGNADKSKLYNSTSKEDTAFNKFEEKNDFSTELANDLDFGLTTPTPTPTPDVSKSSVSNVEDGKMTPEEAEKATIEEEFECDIMVFGGNEFYIPITKGFQIAQYSDGFEPEFGDGVTTFSTNDKNESILKIKIAEENEFDNDYFINFFDNTYMELAKYNTVSNLRATDWVETNSYDFTISTKGVYWETVKDATLTYNGWELAWMKVGNIYVYAEFKTNNEEETVSIEEVSKTLFPTFLYVNEMVE